MIKKKNAQIHFHSKRPYTGTITKMNDIIDIDSTITGSLYYFNYIVVVIFIVVVSFIVVVVSFIVVVSFSGVSG